MRASCSCPTARSSADYGPLDVYDLARMSAASGPTPDDEGLTAAYVSSNGAAASSRTGRIPRIVVLGYITAVALPVIGLIIGIAIVARPRMLNRKHGAAMIVIAVIACVIWVLVLSSGILNNSTTSDLNY